MEEDEVEAVEETDSEEAGITLQDLHEELEAATAESRRGTKRTFEVMKQLSTALEAISSSVGDLQRSVRVPASTAATGDLLHSSARDLVELADRINRSEEAYRQPVAEKTSWWPAAARALKAWSAAWAKQQSAHSILCSHLAHLLQKAGLEHISTKGVIFDPSTMTAIEAGTDATLPDYHVLTELLPGWRHIATGTIIRPAQVRVNRLQNPS